MLVLSVPLLTLRRVTAGREMWISSCTAAVLVARNGTPEWIMVMWCELIGIPESQMSGPAGMKICQKMVYKEVNQFLVNLDFLLFC